MATKKGKPITKSWSYRYLKINGKRKYCKVRKYGGRRQVRVAGHHNTSDKGRSY